MGIYIVGITGASGIVYGLRVIQGLLQSAHDVKLVVSPAGERVAAIELGARFSGRGDSRAAQWMSLLVADQETHSGTGKGTLEYLPYRDVAAPIASGSYPFAGMAIVPCSMGALGRIASGVSTGLIERAADVALKERRPLVLVPRETPLNRVHLRNMLAVHEAGAEVLPAMPAFYHHPRTIADLVDSVAGRILDRLGVANDLFKSWRGDPLFQLANIDE